VDTHEDAHQTAQAPQPEGSLSIQEAAIHYGVAEKTIRRRIKTGALRAVKHPIAEGFEWRVYPEGSQDNGFVQPVHEGTHTSIEAGTQDTLDTSAPPFLLVLEAIERIQREHTEVVEHLRDDNAQLASRNEQLAGQVGFLQAKLQDAERQIALLMAPKDDEPVPAPAERRKRPWWQQIFNR
jgi:hypothetical protein